MIFNLVFSTAIKVLLPHLLQEAREKEEYRHCYSGSHVRPCEENCTTGDSEGAALGNSDGAGLGGLLGGGGAMPGGMGGMPGRTPNQSTTAKGQRWNCMIPTLGTMNECFSNM